jgi:hypothetical protein
MKAEATEDRCSSRQGQVLYHINLDALPGTSVNCERLFSAAKSVLSDTRKRTSPKLFEVLLLLKVNQNVWNIYSVGKQWERQAKAR